MRFAAALPGSKRSMNPIWQNTPGRATAAFMRPVSALVRAGGFSHKVGLPLAAAATVHGARPQELGEADWNAYVARVRALVATGDDCVRTTGSQVCIRRGP